MRNLACSRSVWRCLAGAIVVILLAPLASHAAETYRIDGIPVEATAESGVVARETAIAGGQRERGRLHPVWAGDGRSAPR